MTKTYSTEQMRFNVSREDADVCDWLAKQRNISVGVNFLIKEFVKNYGAIDCSNIKSASAKAKNAGYESEISLASGFPLDTFFKNIDCESEINLADGFPPDAVFKSPHLEPEFMREKEPVYENEPVYQETHDNIRTKEEYVKESVFSKGKKMRELKKQKNYTDEQLAIIFNMSRQNVENMFKLLDLPSKTKLAIKNKTISPTAALELKGLSEKEQTNTLFMLRELDKKPTVQNVKAAVELILMANNQTKSAVCPKNTAKCAVAY